jgi:hypothetical protein
MLVDYGDVTQIAAAIISALQHPWDSAAIKAHAAQFSYPVFEERLAKALGGRS